MLEKETDFPIWNYLFWTTCQKLMIPHIILKRGSFMWVDWKAIQGIGAEPPARYVKE